MSDSAASNTLTRLSAWFDSMHGLSHGYTGPIAHWWESCLLYAGPMIDWRYEGILCGYVTLFEKTGHPYWLDRAVAAGENARRGQLPDGRFRNSSFQAGPIEGGTPHEAAVDVGLLELARVLRATGDERGEGFFQAARHNLLNYQIACLWNGHAFRDQPWNQTLVANKNATTVEALLLYQELSGEDMALYISGAAELVLSAQVTEPGPQRGGVVHLGTHRHRLAVGIYTARCASALVRLFQATSQARYLDGARAMGRFLLTLVTEGGTYFGYYPDGRLIVCPRWISPSGDVLRALLALQPYDDILSQAIDTLVSALANTQLPSGGIPTAYGLGRKGDTRPHTGLPDFRDVLPVVGWNDKAFRALALVAPVAAPPESGVLPPTQIACSWKGQECLYIEDHTQIRLETGGRHKVLYHWIKNHFFPVEMSL